MKNIKKELWMPWWETYYKRISYHKMDLFESLILDLTYYSSSINIIETTQVDILTIIENE